MFVLTCMCGGTSFKYVTRDAEAGVFICNDCETEYTENKAGEHLLESEEE